MRRESKGIVVHEDEALRLASGVVGGVTVLAGLRRRTLGGAMLALGGAALAYRGATGEWPLIDRLGISAASRAEGRATVNLTVARPRSEVYDYWRRLDQLPRFMNHLRQVNVMDERRSRWEAELPGAGSVSWESELVEDEPETRLAWRSLPDSDVAHYGTVRFADAPGGRGTEVYVSVTFRPRASAAAAVAAALIPAFEEVLQADMRRFKQLMEAGEVATTEGQPAAR